jgi:hypothetical protein
MNTQVKTMWASGVEPVKQFMRLTGLSMGLIQSISNEPWRHTADEIKAYEELENRYGFHYKQCGNSIRGDRITLATVVGNYLPYLAILLESHIPILLSTRTPYNVSHSWLPKWVIFCEVLPGMEFIRDPVVLFGGKLQHFWQQFSANTPELTVKLFLTFIDFISLQNFSLSVQTGKAG